MKKGFFSLALASSLLGISVASMASTPQPSASTVAATSSSVRASLNGLTLTFSPTLKYLTDTYGNPVWELYGSSNLDLDDFFTFICDDAYATPTLIDSKHFKVRFDASEFHTMITGMPIFASARVTGDSRDFYAAIWLKAGFNNFSGSSKIWVESNMRPIFYGGQDWYRGKLSTTITNTPRLSVDTSSDGGAFVQRLSSTSFDFSFTFENMIAASKMPAGGQVTFTIVDAAKYVTRKKANIAMQVDKIEMTSKDPYEVWPNPMKCDPAVQSCLDGLPFGSYDTASCGSFREVRRCKITKILPMRAYGIVEGDYLAMLQKANIALGNKTHVIAFGGGYTWNAWNPPTMDQFLEMIIRSERIPGATRLGEIPRYQVEAAMRSVKLDGLIQHLCQQNHEVGCDSNDTTVNPSMRFGLIKLNVPYAMPFSKGNATLYVCIFPNTAKYLAIEVAEQF